MLTKYVSINGLAFSKAGSDYQESVQTIFWFALDRHEKTVNRANLVHGHFCLVQN